MCNRGRNPKENCVNVTINNVDSGFRWQNRYAKWLKDIGFVLFVGFILLAVCAFVAASKDYPSLGQGLAIGAAGSFILAFLTTGPNPWARTQKGVDKRGWTREYALDRFWMTRGLPADRICVAQGKWTEVDMDESEPGIAQVFQGLDIAEHTTSGLRVRYATYTVPNFGPRDVTVGLMGVFILSLDNYVQKKPGPTEILRIEELQGSPCIATLITDFPPEVLRAVLEHFADKFPYLFGGADGFMDPKDLIDAIVPQVATVPPKGPSKLQLVPA